MEIFPYFFIYFKNYGFTTEISVNNSKHQNLWEEYVILMQLNNDYSKFTEDSKDTLRHLTLK